MTAKIYLIDASIYIFRSYFSLPDNWQSSGGESSNAVYGFTQFLINFIEQTQPDLIVCCFDESLGQCFRNDIYPDYKANRALPDDNLAFQLNACKEIAKLLGITCFASSIYEADDLIGSLVQNVLNHPEYKAFAIEVVSRDKDLGQLLQREQDCLWNISDQERLYINDIHKKFGVWPRQLVDYLALVGDSIDNIPGVPGVGPKTAVALLSTYDSIEQIFAHIDDIKNLGFRGAKTVGDKLLDYLEQIAMAKMLATIANDVVLDDFPGCLHKRQVDEESSKEFCHLMGFPRVVPRLEKTVFLPIT